MVGFAGTRAIIGLLNTLGVINGLEGAELDDEVGGLYVGYIGMGEWTGIGVG